MREPIPAVEEFDLDRDMAEALDLNSWTETQGMGSFDQPICCYCRQNIDVESLDGALPGNASGLGSCPHCARVFPVQAFTLAGRRAWNTWKIEPEPEPAP